MELIDTHSHIYYDKYPDIEEVIDRAIENNVSRIICVGVDMESSYKSIKLAEKYDLIFATAGYHPHESKETHKHYLKELEELLNHEKIQDNHGEFGSYENFKNELSITKEKFISDINVVLN